MMNIPHFMHKPQNSAQHFQTTHSPIAAGSSESLLWLTFSTVSKGKFLKSSFNFSILL